MKRHKNLIGLSHDHHHGLRLAQLIKKDAPEYKDLPNDIEGKVKYTINAWEEELQYHFKNEEEILFPAVENKDEEIDELIDEILIEHEEIEFKIKQLQSADDKEEILNKSRQEKFDEGMLHSEEKGRKIGIKVFCGVFIFIVLFNMFFSHGNNTTFYAVSSMFWAFAAGEAFPKYQFTHNKAFMVTTVVGGIASAAYLASFVLSVLG